MRTTEKALNRLKKQKRPSHESVGVSLQRPEPPHGQAGAKPLRTRALKKKKQGTMSSVNWAEAERMPRQNAWTRPTRGRNSKQKEAGRKYRRKLCGPALRETAISEHRSFVGFGSYDLWPESSTELFVEKWLVNTNPHLNDAFKGPFLAGFCNWTVESLFGFGPIVHNKCVCFVFLLRIQSTRSEVRIERTPQTALAIGFPPKSLHSSWQVVVFFLFVLFFLVCVFLVLFDIFRFGCCQNNLICVGTRRSRAGRSGAQRSC